MKPDPEVERIAELMHAAFLTSGMTGSGDPNQLTEWRGLRQKFKDLYRHVARVVIADRAHAPLPGLDGTAAGVNGAAFPLTDLDFPF
jgi:hypothetical protein